MKITRFLVAIITIFCLTLLMSYKDVGAQKSKNPIIVEPVFPKNQNPFTTGYFDLDVTPGSKQVIYLRVSNKSGEEFRINMKTANAFTSETGGIIYEQNISTPGSILLEDGVKLADYMEIEETILVSPYSSVEVPVKVSIPLTNGETVLGGLLFTVTGTDAEQQQEVDEGKVNFVINTEMIYAIAVKLNLPYKTPSNFAFGDASFTAETGQGYFEIINNAQIIEKEVKGTYIVLDDLNNEIFKGIFGPFKMAPKTKIRYPFQWKSETLEAGKYTVLINGSYNGKEINSSTSFEIKQKEIEEYFETNRNTHLMKNEPGTPTWIWVSIAILFGALMFIIGRRKR